jgi:hypothetical protein
MWSLLKSLLLKWALVKTILKALGSLGWLLPLALVLKAVGLPVLMLLAVLAIPLVIVLAVLGLPLLLIVVVGGGLITFTMWLLSMGLFALKLALPFVLIYWIWRWFSRSEPGTPEPPQE